MVHINRIKRDAGFTLIELMAVLGLLTIIALIAVPAIGNIIESADTDSDAASISMVESGARNASAAGLEMDLDDGYSLDHLVSSRYVDAGDSKVYNPSAKVESVGHDFMYFSVHGIGGKNLVKDSVLPAKSHSSNPYEAREMDTPYGRHTVGVYETTQASLTSSLVRAQRVLDVGGTYTFSVWAKTINPGDTAVLHMDLNDTAPTGIHTIGDEWQRISVTSRVTNVAGHYHFADVGIRTRHVPVALGFWQVESGDVMTSYRASPKDFQ